MEVLKLGYNQDTKGYMEMFEGVAKLNSYDPDSWLLA